MVARLVYWRLWLGVMAEKNLLPSPAPSIFPLPSGFFDLLQRKAKAKLSGYRRTTISLVEESNLQTPDTNPNQAV